MIGCCCSRSIRKMMLVLLWFLFCTCTVLSAAAEHSKTKSKTNEWPFPEDDSNKENMLRLEGGGGGSSNSLVASRDIAEGDIVTTLSRVNLSSKTNLCETAQAFVDELWKAEAESSSSSSQVSDYWKYLFAPSASASSKSVWSKEALDVLDWLVGHELEPQRPSWFHYDENDDEENEEDDLDLFERLCPHHAAKLHHDNDDDDDENQDYHLDLAAAVHLLLNKPFFHIPLYHELVDTTTTTTTANVLIVPLDDDDDDNDASSTSSWRVLALRDIQQGETVSALLSTWGHDDTITMAVDHDLFWTAPETFWWTKQVHLYKPWRLVNGVTVQYVQDHNHNNKNHGIRWLTPLEDYDYQYNVMYNHWKRMISKQRVLEQQPIFLRVTNLPEQNALRQYARALTTLLQHVVIALGDYRLDEQQQQQQQQQQQELDCHVDTRSLETAATTTKENKNKDTAVNMVATAVSVDGSIMTNEEAGSTMIPSSTEVDDDTKTTNEENIVCSSSSDERTYDDLTLQRPDPLNYQFFVSGQGCSAHDYNHDEDHEVTEIVDVSSSNYSRLKFDHVFYPSSQTWESCLEINEWLQSCSGFRPHYHEMVVHYPASFVDTVKRVLFLGGGDIMIMHEILKYQSTLELVVGMELDQQVVRSSFRNTGIQPHFFNPVVHWAFGDATKSLLMVPLEWYHSFDLVIVDLQNFVFDTVMVTPELNIMEMAMQMVAPNGVVSRNDDFVRRRNMEFAKYVVDIELHDVPRLCQQSLTMASNGIDFIKKVPVNHGLRTVFFDPIHKHNSTFWTNYRNHEHVGREQQQQQQATKEHILPTVAVATANVPVYGVLVIMEVENVTLPLGISTLLRTQLRHALVDIMGFTEASPPLVLKTTHGNAISFVMDQGYFAGRSFPAQHYIAMDLMLWSDFQKQHDTMKALVQAVGGNYTNGDTTTYSIVASGMYGLHNDNDEDHTKESITTTETSSSNQEHVPTGVETTPSLSSDSIAPTPLDSVDWESVIQEMTSTLIDQNEDTVWMVLCANRNHCPSFKALQKNNPHSQKNVSSFVTCSDISVNDTTTRAALAKCEYALRQHMEKISPIHGIVLDVGLPMEMGQVLHKILNQTSTRYDLLALQPPTDTFIVLDAVSEPWSINLLERIRTEMIRFNPVFHVNAVFDNKSHKQSPLHILSSGCVNFYARLQLALAHIEQQQQQQHPIQARILDSKAGVVSYMPDFELSTIITPDHYDLTDALAQWNSQTPMAHQTFWRFEIQLPKPVLQVNDPVIVNIHEHVWYGIWFSGKVIDVHPDGTYSVIYRGRNKPKTMMQRHLLRKMDIVQDQTYKFGDRVLVRLHDFDGYDEAWYQASVTGFPEHHNGKYMLQIFSDDYGEVFATPSDMIYQYEPADATKHSTITRETLIQAVESAVETLVPEHESQEQAEDEIVFTPMGDGAVVTALWAPGDTLMVTWDGKTRLDVNLFVRLLSHDEVHDEEHHEEDEDNNDEDDEEDSHLNDKGDTIREFQTRLENHFKQSFEYLAPTSVDEQPRGYGRIMNTPKELKSFYFGQLNEFRAAGAPDEFPFASSLE